MTDDYLRSECPFCKEQVRIDAYKCPHCQSEIREMPPPPPKERPGCGFFIGLFMVLIGVGAAAAGIQEATQEGEAGGGEIFAIFFYLAIAAVGFWLLVWSVKTLMRIFTGQGSDSSDS